MKQFEELPVIASCDGCGACCREQCSPPMYLAYLCWPDSMLRDADEEDLERFRNLPEDALQSLEAYRDQESHPDGKPCIWFDEESRQCKHYGHRPEICRTGLERNDEGCRRWREAYAGTLS